MPFFESIEIELEKKVCGGFRRSAWVVQRIFRSLVNIMVSQMNGCGCQSDAESLMMGTPISHKCVADEMMERCERCLEKPETIQHCPIRCCPRGRA